MNACVYDMRTDYHKKIYLQKMVALWKVPTFPIQLVAFTFWRKRGSFSFNRYQNDKSLARYSKLNRLEYKIYGVDNRSEPISWDKIWFS